MRPPSAPPAAELYHHHRVWNTTMLIASLGYFIDVFDMFLFNVLRVPSLTALGLSGEALTRAGLLILNAQVAGIFIGGLLWGVLADRLGRKRALLGSILFYALGSLGCALVQDATVYALLRLLTGIGLAGEISVGVTLVAESVPPGKRNWSVAFFVALGTSAIIAAGFAGQILPWRWCYALGGGAGLAVMLLRALLLETGLFEAVRRTAAPRGSLRLLFGRPELRRRYLCIVFYTMPYFLTVNILMTLAPEFGKATGVPEPVNASTALMIYVAGALVAEILGAAACQWLKSRLKTLWLFMAINAVLAAVYVTQGMPSAFWFYVLCGVMGLFNFWVLVVSIAAENFGTNLRATAASAVNTGRATLLITNSLLLALRGQGLDFLTAAQITAAAAFVIGFACLFGLQETFERDLNYKEEAA